MLLKNIFKTFARKINNSKNIINLNSEIVKEYENKTKINEIIKEDKKLMLNKIKDPITKLEVPEFLINEKLSKYLVRNGICSGNKAKNLISSKVIYVNGKLVSENIIINKNDKVEIHSNKSIKIPMKGNSKIWLFFKPKGLICTHNDPQKRLTIFDFIKNYKLIDSNETIMSIGRLDYNSEGLLLLTNDSEISHTLENPESEILREYRVRVFGRFTEEKLLNIRKGAIIKGIKYGPYQCNIEKRQTKNTWLNIKMTHGKNREIRVIMQKNNLQVGRLIRNKYGPYALGKLKHGNLIEVPIFKEVKDKVYLNLKHKMKKVNLENKEIKKIKSENKFNPKLLEEQTKNLKQIY